MLIDFNKDRLESTLADFSEAIGINISITDGNFKMLSRCKRPHNDYCTYVQSLDAGMEKCICSDNELLVKCKETGKAQFHVCHAGLIDVGVPIIHGDAIIGYLIFGQMKKSLEYDPPVKDASSDKMKKYYDSLVLYDEKRIKSIINIAVMLSKHILLEKMFYSVTNDCTDKCIAYINENFHSHISIKKLSVSVGYSASEIYKSFHKYCSCTVGEYITRTRVDHASAMLVETDLSVEEISSKCGFSGAPYFSKKFKEIMGISPIKYRKQT